ncbi:MAG: hypothetical protein GX799_00705 [Crenarchaeota archaeon]|nr:hypothetical protein [Thermoproteota archaeon]
MTPNTLSTNWPCYNLSYYSDQSAIDNYFLSNVKNNLIPQWTACLQIMGG